jgi:hypothetical protein
MMKEKLKFKKLLNEFRSLESEFAYNTEVLIDARETFLSSYIQWCEKNGVDLKSLEEEKKKQVVIPPPAEHKESYERIETKVKTDQHKEAFKSVAKKIHPDKLGLEDPRRDEYNSAFQRAANAMAENQWGELFDIIDKYQIDIPNYDEANNSLEQDIERMSEKLKKQKLNYAWALENCGDDEPCKDRIINTFIRQTYNWDGIKRP